MAASRVAVAVRWRAACGAGVRTGALRASESFDFEDCLNFHGGVAR